MADPPPPAYDEAISGVYSANSPSKLSPLPPESSPPPTSTSSLPSSSPPPP